MEIQTVEEVLSIIKELGNTPKMYRGQSQDWPLLPSIGRYPKVVQTYNHWKYFQESLLEEFCRIGHPYFDEYPKNYLAKLVFAQHHGLPTNLLDTSSNPLKALFFAVGDPTQDKNDGVLWIIPYQMWAKDLEEKYEENWSNEITPLFPAKIHPRLNAQEGAFISYPLPENIKPLKPLEDEEHSKIQFLKCVIASKNKVRFRKEISLLGATASQLFPDLDGAAKELKNKILEPWFDEIEL